MPGNPFDHLTTRIRWRARARRWRDRLLRPVRPTRVDAARRHPPNLLLVGIDTLRADHLGLGGYDQPTSPGLDRLGARGTVFTDVTAPAPWTLPSFAGALTGRLPGLHGGFLAAEVRNLDTQPPRRLATGVPTLASHLRSLGYKTAAFYSNQFFAFGLAETFDHYEYLNLPAGDLAAAAREWMRCHADGPFFCFLLLNDPHEPTTPAGEDLAPFLPRLAARGIATDDATIGAFARWGEAPQPDLTRAPHPADAAVRTARAVKLAVYDATIRYVDRVVGDLQDGLVERGLDGNTVVSVFSDHGEEFLDHADFAHRWGHDPRGIHGIGHGHALFQEVLHVPWLAWGPGVPAGAQVRQPVSLLDLAPTVLDWLGQPPLPGLGSAGAAAGDLAGDLVGRIASGRDDGARGRLILSEAIAFGPDLVAVRRGPLKLMAHRDGRVLALFDLQNDPGETVDVAAERPGDVAALLAVLERWRASGLGAAGEQKGSWDDLDDTVRRRLKDLGYSE